MLTQRKRRPLRKNNRGQTALEYFMVLAVVILPLAAMARVILEDQRSEKNSNLVRKIVNNSYGTEKSLGVIGRPYP